MDFPKFSGKNSGSAVKKKKKKKEKKIDVVMKKHSTNKLREFNPKNPTVY